MRFQQIHGTNPECDLAVRTGGCKRQRGAVWRQHWWSPKIAGQTERSVRRRIDDRADGLTGLNRTVDEYSSEHTQRNRDDNSPRPTKTLTLIRGRWRHCGDRSCWPIRRNPLQLQLDVVRSLITIFRILLQAGGYNMLKGGRTLRLDRADRFRICLQN